LLLLLLLRIRETRIDRKREKDCEYYAKSKKNYQNKSLIRNQID
jgi:hypothetical protein